MKKVLCLFVIATLFACKSYDTSVLPDANPDGSEALMLQPINDPIEPVNRSLFAVDEFLFENIIYPVEKGYIWAMPEGGRRGVKNFFDNITWPVRLVNNSLQGKWNEAWVETKRFGINTTEGILGFSDPAKTKYSLYASREDLGQTLGTWGWESQMYIYLPILGSMSERDGLGKIGDSFIDPKSYFWPAAAYNGFNSLSFVNEFVHETLQQEYDPYELNKLLYSVRREFEVNDYTFDRRREDTGNTQTLRFLYTKPKNPDFDHLSKKLEVQPKDFSQELPVNYWLQDKPAPVAIVMPGLGEHRLSDSNLMLAELAYEQGYHVITWSSPFNWETVKASPDKIYPGYVADDLHLQEQIINATMGKLKAEKGTEFFKKKSFLGMSMGAWYTLNLAAKYEKEGRKDEFEHFVAINPPQNLIDGLKTIDALYKAPLEGNSIEKAKQIQRSAIVKAFITMQSEQSPDKVLPFTDAEASHLIGFTFKLTLRELIALNFFKDNLSGVSSRSELYDYLNDFTYEDYYQNIILKNLEERGIKKDEGVSSCELQNLGSDLVDMPGVHLVLTKNDFLLHERQLQWFLDKFPKRHTLFENGGHLGLLWSPELQNAVREQMKIQK